LKSAANIAVIMVNYRTPDLTIKSIAALNAARVHGPQFELVVVDGGSRDKSAALISDFVAAEDYRDWAVGLPLDFNGGFGWANNQAILRLLQRDDPPDYIYLINPDTEVAPDAVAHLATALDSDPKCAAAGSQLIEQDGNPAGSAFRFPSIGREFVAGANTPLLGRLLNIKPVVISSDIACDVDWVTGASVMFRSAALRQSGLFDEGFFLYYEEVDLMARLKRLGWQIRHVPESRVTHVGGAATGVGQNSDDEPKPLPHYWYQSRRRYFGLRYGLLGGAIAGLARFSGYIVWRLRAACGLARSQSGIPQMGRDLWSAGLIPTPSDRLPVLIDWQSATGSLPLWCLRK
jgi:N-acetylglucosaminyl-diphospho-decaprenol L-rhamnosyltransferase